jgi:hypothetical protein
MPRWGGGGKEGGRVVCVVFFLNNRRCVPQLICILVQATELKTEEVEFNGDFISRMLPRLNWKALTEMLPTVSTVLFGCKLSCAWDCAA